MRTVASRTLIATAVALLVILLAVLLAVLFAAAPAAAHVTVQPGTAAQGDTSVRVMFLAPTEGQSAATVGLEIHFPEEVPIVGVTTVPVPGWSVEVTRRDLDEPVTDHHGAPITSVVDTLMWTANDEQSAIGPGEAGEFPVVFGMLPEADELVFRALQHYSDGEIVRWIELPEPGGHPHHPAPVLRLQPALPDAGEAGSTPGSATGDSAGDSASTGSSSTATSTAAIWIGLAGLAAGLAGLAFGSLAYFRTRQPTEPPAP